MSMFTEGSYHRNISVIFIVQNLRHQGRRSRSLNMNTQYLMLYKNPRDMQQIKTIAQQMYPTNWRCFLAYFEMEMSRPYGKVIINLHPETKEKDRFVVDDDVESPQINDIVDSSSTVLQRMDARQEMQHPYMNAVQNKKEEMQRLLQTPSLMTESEKAIKYNQMMNDIIAYKNKLQSQVAL